MPKQRLRFWLSAAAALLAGLLLRLWFLHHFAHIAGDSLLYGDIARNLLLHHTYGFTEQGAGGSVQIRPTLIRLPGYPLFLAACFRVFGMEHYGSALNVQVAADLLSCVAAAALAGRLFARRAILPVLWLAAVCPFTANYCAAALTEILVLTTIALAFYALERWLRAGCAIDAWCVGVACALSGSILLRPEQGILAAAVIPAMFVGSSRVRPPAAAGPEPTRRRRVPPALMTAVLTLLPLAPWTLRNWQTFRVVQPLAPRSATDPGEPHVDGFNGWYRGWAIDFASTEDVYWNYNGSTIDPADLPARAMALGCRAPDGTAVESLPLYGSTAALLNEYNRQTTGTPEVDARFAALAAQRAQAAPFCTRVLMPLARLGDMTLRPRTEMLPVPSRWWQPSTTPRQRVFAIGYAAINLGYLALAALGLRKAFGRTNASTRLVLWAMAASLLLRCGLLLTLDNSEARYTLEFFPVLFVFAGGLLVEREPDAGSNAGADIYVSRTL